MKIVSGLTDSLGNLVGEPVRCPECGGLPRLANGLCLTCLLQAGLESSEESGENFVSLLAKVDMPDTHWRVGHYEILEEIARGGMGVVYRARQQFSRKIVALKCVLSHYADSPATLARFRRESEAASLLDHPNILPIYEVGETEEGLPFFAMKFAPGGSLRDGRVALGQSPRQVVPILLKVCRAVDAAHAAGLLHRDLKPGNILLDARGEPLVSDFGLAKWLDASSDLTRTLTIFGTPGYIAPEQVRSPARMGPAADIYSLGAILFDLLSGRPPFLGENALGVISQAAENNAPTLRSIVPSIDRNLETICIRCLERDPSARYVSAAALADDLERWLQGRPILARPVAIPEKLWRWTRRNPMLAGSAVVCALSLLLSGVKIFESRAAQQQEAVFQHSVAVLPFLDLDSGRPDSASTSEAVNTLRPELEKSGPARVVEAGAAEFASPGAPRIEEMAWAARRLKTRTVLLGTKRVVDGKSLFSIHLVDLARSESPLLSVDLSGAEWTDHFRRNATDLYRALGQAADNTTPGPKEGEIAGKSPAAELLTVGRLLMDRRTAVDCDRAIVCFRKAIAADPTSAPAHAFLAMAFIGRSFLGGEPGLIASAEEAARKSIALDPRSSEAHRALSNVLEQKGDLQPARAEAFRAIELRGVDERAAGRVASIVKLLGRPDVALYWHRIVKNLQNRPADNEFIIGDCWADLGEDERAERAYRRTSELHSDLPEGWMGLCRLALLQGRFELAEQIASQNLPKFSESGFARQMMAQVYFFSHRFEEARKLYLELARADETGGGYFYGAVSYESALGYLDLVSGKKEKGRQTLKTALDNERNRLRVAPRHPETLYRIAAIEAALGEPDPALDYLREAMLEGWLDFRSLTFDPRFDSLRHEVKFKELLASMTTQVSSLRRLAPTDEKGRNERSGK